MADWTYPKDLVGTLKNWAKEAVLPPDKILGSILDAVFFGSIRREEGNTHPISIVVAIPQKEQEYKHFCRTWEVLDFDKSVSLDSARLAKMASISSPSNASLVVAEQNERIEILGIAIPPKRNPFLLSIRDKDHFVCVDAPAPAQLEITLSGTRILLYADGQEKKE